MKTSGKGIALIKKYEGFRAERYLCPAGLPTIGYGHVIREKEYHLIDAKLTEEMAVKLLANDLIRFEDAVNKVVKVPITQCQFDAIVSLTYNIGTGAMATSTMIRKLNAGDASGAMLEFLRWNKSGGKVLNGLAARRQAEANLFMGVA
jgi:lysozyme